MVFKKVAKLPYDKTNPIIVTNDGNIDVYTLEYVMALASADEIELVGIVGENSLHYPDIVAMARRSGMRNIPDPVIGAGMSLMGKADVNKDFDKTHYSLAYGYHARGGLHILVKQKATLMVDLIYNLILPPATEDLGLSGVLVSMGIRLPFKNLP